MIIDIAIGVALILVATFLQRELLKAQKNIVLLNNYAFSSFERIIEIEALINDNTEDDDDDEA